MNAPGRVAIRLDTRHERAAERVAATRQARLARRPVTTIEELVILLTAAADERTSDAFFETFWDRATPEVAAAFEEAIPAEAARWGAGGWTKQD